MGKKKKKKGSGDLISGAIFITKSGKADTGE